MIFVSSLNDLKLNSLSSIYFYEDWLDKHSLKKMNSVMEKMEKKHSNINFYAINLSIGIEEVKKRFSLRCLPTVIAMKDGKEIKRVEGLQMTSVFNNFYNKVK